MRSLFLFINSKLYHVFVYLVDFPYFIFLRKLHKFLFLSFFFNFNKMKFGLYLEENQFPPWKNEYINYNELKYFLKERQLQQNDGWTQEDENYFAETLIVSELDKVNGFIYMKTKQVGNDPKRISDLIQFIQINDIGFYKILKKHDKWTGISLLNSIRFRDIHHQFQSMMDRLQQQINFLQRKESTKELVEEEPVTTTTTKFWVHSDNLTEVQAILMFHLPPISQTLINTVYFDDPQQFTLYSNLLERNQKAEMIRARWFVYMCSKLLIYTSHNKMYYVGTAQQTITQILTSNASYIRNHGRTTKSHQQKKDSIY